MLPRSRGVALVFRAAFANPTLRRAGIAYALYGAAEFGIWIALLVYADGHGGASAAMTMVLVQLIPCIALGPFLGALADRRRPSRVLCVAYGLQAVSMTAVAVAIGTGSPAIVVFALAPLTALSLTAVRPPQAALLPAIVRTPDELTAANVLGGWTDAAAALVGPALVGLLLAWRGPALAVAAMAGMSLLAMGAVVGVTGPAPALASAGDGEARRPADGSMAGVRRALASIRAGARDNVVVVMRNPQIRVLLALHTFYLVLIGALDLLCVLLAATYLHMGSGGAGFLNAAVGAGALIAGFVTAFLVGRRRLAPTLVVALGVAVVALMLIG
ncbi:MAG TPA: MFS transporter, partial [Acidimicrobiales bacterium]|nr:MFS transporter [Acidimicrobiales bacterium]